MDLKEIEEFNNGVASIAFYLPLLVVQVVLSLFYPIVILTGLKTWGDYMDFLGSVVTNTWEVPRIIFYNIYAIGFNGFYILYLVIYTGLLWIW